MFKLLQSVLPRGFVNGYAKPLACPHGPALTPEQFDDVRELLFRVAPRLNKILVNCTDPTGKTHKLEVTPLLDSPLSCAEQISPSLASNCALGIVNYGCCGWKQTLSPTSPLMISCDLEIVDLHSPKAEHRLEIDKAFWRSAGIMTAAAASTVFPSTPIYPLLNADDGFYTVIFEDEEFGFPKEKMEHELSETMDALMNSNHFFENLYVPDFMAEKHGFKRSLKLCKLADRVFAVDGPTIAFPGQIGYNKPFPTCSRPFYHKDPSTGGSIGYLKYGGFAVPTGTKVGGKELGDMYEDAWRKFQRHRETCHR